MATWGELLANLRADLKDPQSEKPKWTNETLWVFTMDAIRDYSMDLPKDVYRYQLTASNGCWTVPANFLNEKTIELEAGYYLEKAVERPGARIRSSYTATTYRIIGGKIYTEPSPTDGATCLLTYYAIHDGPADPSDTEAVISVPVHDEELIRLYAKAKAIEQFRTSQSNLDKFKPSGERDDNPLYKEHEFLMSEYRRKLADRSGGIVLLYKVGRIK